MEVSMSKTRRGKYTDNRICYISKCKGDMRLYLRRKGKLPCFNYLVRGKSFSFYRGKIQIKSEKLTPVGVNIFNHGAFDSTLSSVIDSTLGLRCKSFGYRYSEIIRSLMSIYFCGGSCIEDITTHLLNHLSLHPTLRTCSSDTILRAIKELTQENISYTSDTGKNYDFNTADTLNTLLLFVSIRKRAKDLTTFDAAINQLCNVIG